MTVVLDSVPSSAADVPSVVSDNLDVPLVTGGCIQYANLDHAASAPCLEPVRCAVAEFLPWHASVHRSAGIASRVSTQVYEQARERVRRFVDAYPRDTVIFTRNTTDALNLLARCLPRGTSVVCFDTEHHAGLLPWRGPYVHRIPTPGSREAAVSAADEVLAGCVEGPRLLVVSGASNVTGELLPVGDLASVARHHGARVAVDVAQLAPHRRVSIRELDVDYVALSGHKLYAPFGAGALVGPGDWLRAAPPYLAGGGATRSVKRSSSGEISVSWQVGPERHEAGSPNTVGAYALGVACDTLTEHWDDIRAHEDLLLRQLTDGLASIAGLAELRLLAGAPERVGTVSFVIEGFDSGWLAAVLSAEYGIGVRDGAFCAHIATRRLVDRTGIGGSSALRASIGLSTTAEHVERLIGALRTITHGEGARWTYERVDGRWAPTPDPRQLPQLP